MPVDMKETIAEAARTLLMEKRKKKLTVKDIVDECSIILALHEKALLRLTANWCARRRTNLR